MMYPSLTTRAFLKLLCLFTALTSHANAFRALGLGRSLKRGVNHYRDARDPASSLRTIRHDTLLARALMSTSPSHRCSGGMQALPASSSGGVVPKGSRGRSRSGHSGATTAALHAKAAKSAAFAAESRSPSPPSYIGAPVDVICDRMSKHLFALTMGYPGIVAIMQKAYKYATSLTDVVCRAVDMTKDAFTVPMNASSVALAALNEPVPPELIVLESLQSNDPAERKRCMELVSFTDGIRQPVPPGFTTLDKMVSEGAICVQVQGWSLNEVIPYAPPMMLLAHCSAQVAAADITAAQSLVSDLLIAMSGATPDVVQTRALALLASRRLQLLLLPDDAKHLSTNKSKTPRIVADATYRADLIAFLMKLGSCTTTEEIETLRANTSLNLLQEFTATSANTTTTAAPNASGTWFADICTLVADARAMVGAYLLPSPPNNDVAKTIYDINSRMLTRWHARLECTMRRLRADADQYIGRHYKAQSVYDHYDANQECGNRVHYVKIDWTQPLELTSDVAALPNRSDATAMARASGKMHIMRDDFPGCNLAWIDNCVNSDRETGLTDARPMLFLEIHIMPAPDAVGAWERLEGRLESAYKQAVEVAGWAPADVVFVVKSTRAVNSTKLLRIHSNKNWGHKRLKKDETRLLKLFTSTNVIILDDSRALGRYLGPMLWHSLKAGDALAFIP